MNLITMALQSLSQFNPDSYTILDTVLDSEPLHDLKRHLINLLTEIPHLFSGDCKRIVLELLDHLVFLKKQNGCSGSDLSITLINSHSDVDVTIKELLSTAVKIPSVCMLHAINAHQEQFCSCTMLLGFTTSAVKHYFLKLVR